MIEERQAAEYAGRQRAGRAGEVAPGLRLRAGGVALHAGVILLYTLLAVVVSWPMARSFTTAVIGAEGAVDAYQCAWNLWWVASSLSQGRLPFFTWLLFFPQGVDLFWQTLQFSQAVVALPITLALGPLAGFNWAVLSSFAIGGYVTFLFARRVTGSAPGALVAGAVFAFSPYHMQKVVDGGLEVSSVQWLPCYFFALYLLLERPGIWRSLLCGALLLWVSLGSWYYGLFSVMITGCAALVWLLIPGAEPAAGPRRGPWPGRERWAAAIWGLTPVVWWGLALLPRIAGLVAEPDALFDMRALQARRSADLMDFFLPNPLHPLWGPAVRAAREQLYPQAIIWNVALGWVGLALGLLGAVVAWRSARRWLALLGVTLLLALGPTLRVLGHDTGVPLPFALIQDLPGIRANQRPNHIVVIGTLLLAILAAYSVAWLCRRLSRRGGAALAGGAVALVLAVDAFAGPMAVVSRPIHPFYRTLPPPPFSAEGRPLGAIMPLPLYVNVNRSENLTPQMVHGWPILGGYVARPPAYDFSRYTPGVREIQGEAPVRDDIVGPGWPEAGRHGLAAAGVRYITFDLTSDKDAYFALVRAHAAELGLGPPVFADAALEVYAVPQGWPAGPVGFLGPGWNELERQEPFRWRWMGPEAELRLLNPLDRPTLATLTFTAASYAQPRPLDLRLDGAALASLTVDSAGPQTRAVSFLLPPGEHTLRLSAPAAPDPQRAGAPISLRFFAIDFRFAEPASAP
jgi:hypothetical protein